LGQGKAGVGEKKGRSGLGYGRTEKLGRRLAGSVGHKGAALSKEGFSGRRAKAVGVGGDGEGVSWRVIAVIEGDDEPGKADGD
jgi:hypothetical protein